MDRRQLQWSLLKLTFLVVGLSTWALTAFVLSTRPGSQGAEVSEGALRVTAAADALNTLVRLPASLPTSLPKAIPGLATGTRQKGPVVEMKSLMIPCWDVQDRAVREIDARWVRFTGRTCKGDGDMAKVALVNSRNQYSATLLKGSSSRWTSDYILLEEGENEIVIQVKDDKAGFIENRYKIVRQ